MDILSTLVVLIVAIASSTAFPACKICITSGPDTTWPLDTPIQFDYEAADMGNHCDETGFTASADMTVIAHVQVMTVAPQYAYLQLWKNSERMPSTCYASGTYIKDANPAWVQSACSWPVFLMAGNKLTVRCQSGPCALRGFAHTCLVVYQVD